MVGRRTVAFAAPLAVFVALAGVSRPVAAASVSAQIFLGSQILGLNEQQSQFDYAAAAVPEPSTALLVGAGLAGLSRAARLSSGRRPPARAARSRSSGLPQDRGR
jgi:hypothetical protein